MARTPIGQPRVETPMSTESDWLTSLHFKVVSTNEKMLQLEEQHSTSLQRIEQQVQALKQSRFSASRAETEALLHEKIRAAKGGHEPWDKCLQAIHTVAHGINSLLEKSHPEPKLAENAGLDAHSLERAIQTQLKHEFVNFQQQFTKELCSQLTLVGPPDLSAVKLNGNSHEGKQYCTIPVQDTSWLPDIYKNEAYKNEVMMQSPVLPVPPSIGEDIVYAESKFAKASSQLPNSPETSMKQRKGSSENSRNCSPQKAEKKPLKSWMAEDQELDVTHIQVKENTSLAEVFLYDTSLDSAIYRVEDYYNRSIWAHISASSWFANLTVLVVAGNAVYLGVESDFNDANNLYDADRMFQIASQFFAFYFTAEILIRFLAFEKKQDCLRDGWFKFDLFLVTTMIMDIWMLMPLLKFLSGGDEKVSVPTQPLRMLRLFKLSRMARLMKAFPELVTMIKALVHSLRAIASSMILIGLMVYTWSILLMSLLKPETELNEFLEKSYDFRFDRMSDCMWVLLAAGTLMLDNTAPLVKALLFSDRAIQVISGACFVIYLFLSALLILQMLIGVLCDVVSQQGHDARAAEAVALVKQELLGDLRMFEDGEGKISKQSLRQVLESPASKATLKKLKINRLFLTNVANLMFHDTTAAIPVKTIMELMIMCRGDNGANVSIISSALCFLTKEIKSLKHSMGILEDEEGDDASFMQAPSFNFSDS